MSSVLRHSIHNSNKTDLLQRLWKAFSAVWAGRLSLFRPYANASYLKFLPVLAFGVAFGLAALPSQVAVGQIAVTSGLYDRGTTEPGGTYTGSFRVTNQSDTTRTVQLTKKGFNYSIEKGPSYLEPDSLSRSNADWLSLPGKRIQIPAKSSQSLTYEVTVPETSSGDSPTGSYWSIIMLRPSNPPTSVTSEGIAIRQVRRYALQTETIVKGDADPKLSVVEAGVDTLRSSRQAGQANSSERGEPGPSGASGKSREASVKKVFSVGVENGGKASTIVSAEIELYDQSSGDLVADGSSTEKRLYPGFSNKFNVKLPSSVEGDYRAILIIRSKNGKDIGRQFEINI